MPGSKINVRHYSISHKKSYSILEVAKMFKSRINFLKSRPGERYASKLTKFSQNNRIIKKIWKNKFERLYKFVY